jgi:hypothetical protein
VTHYLGNSHVINHVFVPGIHAGLGSWWPAVLAAAVVGPLLCLAPGPPADRLTRVLGGVALASVALYLVTPESAAGPAGDPLGFAFNLRYSAPALALALSVAPLAPGLRPPRAQNVTTAALGIALIATVAQARLWPSAHLAGAIAVGAIAAGLAVALLRAPGMRRPGPVPALAAAGTLVLAAAAGGYALQRHYLRGRYEVVPGVSHLSPVWALFRGVHHARVGIVGTFGGFFSYPLYGRDDSNLVQYIGRRGPHGSFTPIGTCAGWRKTVDAGGYRYLVTTPARDPWHPNRLGFSPEGAWTADDPAARVVFRVMAFGQPISVFELSGPLHPGDCLG